MTKPNNTQKHGYFFRPVLEGIIFKITNAITGAEYEIFENGMGGLAVDSPASGIFKIEITTENGNGAGYYFRRECGEAGAGYDIFGIKADEVNA